MGVEGIEPPTPRASIVCSPTELHSQIMSVMKIFKGCVDGEFLVYKCLNISLTFKKDAIRRNFKKFKS